MQTYELLVKNRSVKANSDDITLVRGSIGIDQVYALFDNEEWLSFPITVTFGNGKKVVTVAATINRVTDSEDWVAETTVEVPWEVVQSVGAIRITFQGTDANGNHIITAFGAPLRVEESGDVTMGDIPSDAPTVSQYEQVYAEVVSKLAEVSAALAELGDVVTRSDVATASMAGIVRPDGTTILIDSDGTIRTAGEYELVAATYTSLGVVKPDGNTITVDDNGTIHGAQTYVLPKATGGTLGGIIVGGGLSTTTAGVLSADIFTDEEIEELTPMDVTVSVADGVDF